MLYIHVIFIFVACSGSSVYAPANIYVFKVIYPLFLLAILYSSLCVYAFFFIYICVCLCSCVLACLLWHQRENNCLWEQNCRHSIKGTHSFTHTHTHTRAFTKQQLSQPHSLAALATLRHTNTSLRRFFWCYVWLWHLRLCCGKQQTSRCSIKYVKVQVNNETKKCRYVANSYKYLVFASFLFFSVFLFAYLFAFALLFYYIAGKAHQKATTL